MSEAPITCPLCEKSDILDVTSRKAGLQFLCNECGFVWTPRFSLSTSCPRRVVEDSDEPFEVIQI